MDFFRPFLSASCFLLAWWIMAMHGYAAVPNSFSRVVLLILSTIMLTVQGTIFNRQNCKVSALFTWSYAWACWAFFAETLWLLHQDSPSWQASLTIYNLFRYFLMIMVFIVLLKQWVKTLRGFGHN